ncbi:MAG: YdjY domain-containing protein [Planctomycetota bacterium]
MNKSLAFALLISAAATFALALRLNLRPEPTPPAPVAATNDAAHETLLAAMDARMGRLEEKLEVLLGSGEDPATEKKLSTLLERVDEMASQIYDFEQENRRDLMRLQANVLRGIGKLGAPGPRDTPADPAALKKELAEKGVELSVSGKWIRVEGHMKPPERPLEAIAVMEGGPTHETMFVIEAEALAIRNALVALGCKTGEPPDWRREQPPTGQKLWIYVDWEGLARPWRLEDMINDARDGTSMKEGNWVFVGSQFVSDMRTGDEYFAADAARIAMTLVHKFANVAVIASAHPDAGNEQIWVRNPDTLPKDPDARIRITIAPQRLEHMEWR